MNTYELVLIFPSSLTAEEQKKQIVKVEKLLEGTKGKIVVKEEWGQKMLAYTIKKNTDGFYWFLKINAEPKTAVALHNLLRLDDLVVRHLLSKV